MNDLLHPIAVINPKSASGKTGKRWPSVAPLVLARQPNAEMRMTSAAGEATEITRAALREGPRMIIAAGGDGTINEVLNGFFDEAGELIAPQASLAVLPLGTGSDLCRSLGVPRDPKLAVNLLSEPAQEIDCGRAVVGDEAHMFLNIASLGISGEIAEHFEEHGKNGVMSYVSGLFSVARRYEDRGVTLRLLDESSDAGSGETRSSGAWIERQIPSLFTLAIANGQYFGGGMHVAPDARVNDGAFQCVWVRGLGYAEIVRYLPALFRGKHLKLEPFNHMNASAVELIAQRDTTIELDGEPALTIPEGGTAEIKLLRGAMRVHAGRRAPALA